MSPDEDEPIFSDLIAKRLYDIVQVKSADVGFCFGTEMLMFNIIGDFEESVADEDFETSVKYRKGGDLIWSRIEPHLDQVKDLLKEWG